VESHLSIMKSKQVNAALLTIILSGKGLTASFNNNRGDALQALTCMLESYIHSRDADRDMDSAMRLLDSLKVGA
jgi:hypothetical protein